MLSRRHGPRARRRSRRCAATGPPLGAQDGTLLHTSARQREASPPATRSRSRASGTSRSTPTSSDSAVTVRYYISSVRATVAPNPRTHPTPSRDQKRTLVGDADTSSLRSRASGLCARTRLPRVSASLLTHLFSSEAEKHRDGIFGWPTRLPVVRRADWRGIPGNAKNTLYKKTPLFVFAISGCPKTHSPGSHFGRQ